MNITNAFRKQFYSTAVDKQAFLCPTIKHSLLEAKGGQT
jgi:hypothetical protein